MKKKTALIIYSTFVVCTFCLLTMLSHKKPITNQHTNLLEEEIDINSKPSAYLTKPFIEHITRNAQELGWRLWSKNTTWFSEKNRIIAHDIYANIMQSNNVIGTVQGARAIIDTRTHDIFLSGLLTGTFDSACIQASNVHYQPSSKNFESKKQLTVKIPNQIIFSADSFKGNLETHFIALEGNIKTTLL